jgi:hypothetical protein
VVGAAPFCLRQVDAFWQHLRGADKKECPSSAILLEKRRSELEADQNLLDPDWNPENHAPPAANSGNQPVTATAAQPGAANARVGIRRP